MLKYVDTLVSFSEVPDEISLCINLSGCPHKCEGCHSPYLREDIGTKLDDDELEKLVKQNEGITCVCFMGGDNDVPYLEALERFVKRSLKLRVCWYTGRTSISGCNIANLDYFKIGPYIEELGPLTSPTTNQRFYVKGEVLHKKSACKNMFYDITDRFYNK